MPLPTVRNVISGDIDKLFDNLWSDWNLPLAVEMPATPALDVYEKDGAYVAEMAVPGYKNEDIDVEVNGSVLTVSGKYDQTTKQETAKYHRREIRRGAFKRAIVLPQEIDANAVKAKVERGILCVTATPVKPMASKKVTVTGE